MNRLRTMVTELLAYRHLVLELAWRDVRIRYKQTVLGFLWVLLMPALIVVAGMLVKRAFAAASNSSVGTADMASVAVKSVPWVFFVASVRLATTSLIGNLNLVTKIYFPREVFPLAATLTNLLDFLVACVVLAVMLAAMGIGVSVQLVWVPLLVALLVLLTAGIAMLCACTSLFFRDVKYLVEVLVTFGIFFTPVFYEARMLGPWEPVLLLNPVAPILEALSAVVVSRRPPDARWVLYAAVWAVGGFLAAWTIFDAAEPTFAERI